ncbi:MAG: hypothetical protein Kow0077_02720 [Anaerolineae bacterium]
MITRILLVDTDARALARIKNALELAGPYEAHVFVTGKAAREYATEHRPDLAILSLNVTDVPADDLARDLRAAAPNLPIIVRVPPGNSAEGIESVQAQAVFEGAYAARKLIPVIESALHRSATPSRPDIPPPSMPDDLFTPSPDDDLGAFGEVLESIQPGQPQAEEDSFRLLVESMRVQHEKPPLPKRRDALPVRDDAAADEVFEKLLEEEPPVPSFEDSGTVSDLIAAADLANQEDAHGVKDIPDDMILDLEELAQDEQEEQRELLRAISAMDEPPTHEIEADIPPASSEPEITSPPPEQPFTPPEQADASPAPPREPLEPQAAYALHLTQHTLQSAIQASVLIKEGTIVASAGDLPESDLHALAAVIDSAAVLAENVTKLKYITLPELRMNYVVVAAPTIDDMVLLTVFPENLHVGVIRGQAQALVQTLADLSFDEPEPELPTAPPEPQASVESVTAPEAAPAPVERATEQETAPRTPETPTETAEPDRATMTSYACVWLVRDPAATLSDSTQETLHHWLQRAAAEHGWLVDYLDIQPDFISVVIAINKDTPPRDMITTLMADSAQQVAQAQPDLGPVEQLWADAYYMVTPGRPLTPPEISQFISYQRQHQE